MKKSLFIIIMSLALVACEKAPVQDSVETTLKKAVLARLKDPDSAKFGKFTLVSDKAACVTVNARNGFGGYGGDQQAHLTKENGTWDVLLLADVSHERCVDYMATIK